MQKSANLTRRTSRQTFRRNPLALRGCRRTSNKSGSEILKGIRVGQILSCAGKRHKNKTAI